VRKVANGHAWAVFRCDDGLPFEGECMHVKDDGGIIDFDLHGNVAHTILMAKRVSVLHGRTFYSYSVTCLDSVIPQALLRVILPS
jgi:hypothetical protein